MGSTKIPLIFSPSLLTRSVQGHTFSVPRRRHVRQLRPLGQACGVAAARAARGRPSLVRCGALRWCQIPTTPWCVCPHRLTAPRLSSGDNKQEGEGALSLSLTDSWPELLQMRAPAFSTGRWRCKTVVPGGLYQAQGSSISRRR